jgi:hypothetical protein
MNRLDPCFSGPGLHLARFGPVCIALWQAQPTLRLFEMQRLELAGVVRAYPRRAAFLCIIEPSADPPDQEVRSASVEMITAHGDNLAATCCVVEGSGFRAALTRTVLAGIQMLSRTKSPVKFVEDVNAATVWLGDRMPSGQVAGLRPAVADWRRGLGAGTAPTVQR